MTEKTTCQDVTSRLDDYVDGELAPSEAEEMRQHLGQCLRCRRELKALETLLLQAQSLPREEVPERDLWPELAAGLQGARAPQRRAIGRFLALAAAAALVLVTSATTFYLSRPDAAFEQPPQPGRIVPASYQEPAPSDLASIEADFEEVRQELLQALDERRHRISPETQELVEENLQVIQNAIGEIQLALEDDPESPELNMLLVATYQKEIDLLSRLNHLSI